MANELQELLKEVKDERLKARLSAAIAELRKTKKFGLVFEEHLPEPRVSQLSLLRMAKASHR
jgi:hypothetical protein